MKNTINLGVYRRLDNRLEGLSDDSPRAIELHNRRKEALHNILESVENIEVTDWGRTDDSDPHEFVELTIGAIATATLSYIIVPGVKFIAEKLAEKAIDEGASELAKWIISKFRSKQESKEILDFQIRFPDGTFISVDPPDGNAEIRISFSDGSVSGINYKKE